MNCLPFVWMLNGWVPGFYIYWRDGMFDPHDGLGDAIFSFFVVLLMGAVAGPFGWFWFLLCPKDEMPKRDKP
jgi:hypothetical protein